MKVSKKAFADDQVFEGIFTVEPSGIRPQLSKIVVGELMSS